MSEGGPAHGRRGAGWLVLFGLPIGLVGSLCGIGGGLFAGPLLHWVRGLELRSATGTALVLVLATTSASTVTELLRADSPLSWRLVAALVVGVLVGAQIGFALSERLPERVLRVVFAVALLAAAGRLLLGAQGGAPEAGTAGFEPGLAELALALCAGLGGGFVSPVLGVGGGLVMVPALYLGVAGLGFDGARACSLGAGVVAAARALTLKARAGRVAWGPGVALGAGALAGAAAGVLLLDRLPGLGELGRVLLGLVLIGVALRFARDVLRDGGARAQA